jgi:hypothetical protein
MRYIINQLGRKISDIDNDILEVSAVTQPT